MQQYDLQQCHTNDDRIPIQEWLESLDRVTRSRIRICIDRMEEGNFGVNKSVGEGVSELKIGFGAGYRVYFAIKGEVVHLLSGGKKDTQEADIKFAKDFWSKHGKD